MTIAVIGAGAIGSVVAAYLTKAGVDVTLIGKDEQVTAIKANGLNVRGVRGEDNVRVKVATKLARNYDLVIFTVKTQDIESAFVANHSYLENTLILSSQNGVQADQFLKRDFPAQNLYSSIVMFGSTYTKPGEVLFNFEGDWILGKPFESNDENTEKISQVLGKAFNTVISDDIVGMKWLKLFVNFNNCLPALIGQSMQETFADMDLCRLSIMLLKEGVDIVEKKGIKLVSLPQFPADRIYGMVHMPIDQAAGIINKTLTTLSKEPLYGSILQSIMRKRTSEIDYINGEVVQLAKDNNWDAPFNQKVVEMVHEVERNQKYFDVNTVKNLFNLSLKEA